MPPLLRATNLSKSYAGVQALRGVSFDLAAGEVHALVGENGAGKSTLIKVLTGAIQPDSGTVEILERSIEHNDPLAARRLGVAAIYQQPALFPDLTVAENITLGVERSSPFARVRWKQRSERATELLARVAAQIHPNTVVERLSMPEQQLVEIARALGANARVLIMDEPTASLSEREVERLLQVVKGLRGQGVGIIYISHRLDELPQIADRVTVLRDGAAIATRPMSALDRTELIRLMVGRNVGWAVPTAPLPTTPLPTLAVTTPPLLELRNISSRAAGIHDVTLELRAGEILGLAGLVGAGRTELARVLFGLMPADAGQILLRGKPVVIDSPRRAIDLGIAYVPEDRRRHGVILELPVAANTSLALLSNFTRGGRFDTARERALATDMVQRLGIKTPSIATPAGDLSGGNQQKVALARWLATKPAVLILDEPTQGIDVGAKGEIHKLMGELARQGLAILMISSELPEILGMSNRIAVMRSGRIVSTLARASATQEQILSLALGHQASLTQQRGANVPPGMHN